MTLRRRYLDAQKMRRLVATEREDRESYDLPLRRRLWLWRRGFLSRSDYLYDLDGGRHREYLTDYERYVWTPRINGEWVIALSNKLVFHWLCSAFDEHRPAVYGMVRDGRFLSVGGDAPPRRTDLAAIDGPDHGDDAETTTTEADSPLPTDGGVVAEGGSAPTATDRGAAAAEVTRRLEADGRLVLKWTRGGGGQNVYVCSYRDGEYRVNDEPKTAAEFASVVADLDDYLVCEFVEQFDLGEAIYPGTTNTLRILTMYDESAGEPFVPIAIYRTGTDRSAPMDNFSRGGLSAEVDVRTGRLGPAAQLPQDDLVFRAEHPDTGERIEGVEIPGWASIRDRVLEIAAANAHVPYVGWDVVPTDDEGGFRIIEANSYPGMKSLQVHRPLLADDRTRAFYERHGVLQR
jgi:hypothetical protein